MSEITPRSPLINWDKGFINHWNENSAATHAFNALSFMFPQGERFFIKVVKNIQSGCIQRNGEDIRIEIQNGGDK